MNVPNYGGVLWRMLQPPVALPQTEPAYQAPPMQTVEPPPGYTAPAPAEVNVENVAEALKRFFVGLAAPTSFPEIKLMYVALLGGILGAGVIVGRRWGRS